MKISQTAYIIENHNIKQVEVIKITRDFITVRYKTILPDRFGKTFESKGGLRLRRNRVFDTKQEAEEYLKRRN